MSLGHCIAGPVAYLWELVMRAEKTVSEETLRRLWSEVALLRQEVEQAECDRAESQTQATSAIVAARARLQSRSDRYR